jgi:hypothetical protein
MHLLHTVMTSTSRPNKLDNTTTCMRTMRVRYTQQPRSVLPASAETLVFALNETQKKMTKAITQLI